MIQRLLALLKSFVAHIGHIGFALNVWRGSLAVGFDTSLILSMPWLETHSDEHVSLLRLVAFGFYLEVAYSAYDYTIDHEQIIKPVIPVTVAPVLPIPAAVVRSVAASPAAAPVAVAVSTPAVPVSAPPTDPVH